MDNTRSITSSVSFGPNPAFGFIYNAALGVILGAGPAVIAGRSNNIVKSVFLMACVGVSACQIWHRKGKDFVAKYIANAIDASLKSQAVEVQNVVIRALEKKFPLPGVTPYIKKCVGEVVKEKLEAHRTNPQLISKIIDNIDHHVPSKPNPALDKFASHITESIIEKKGWVCGLFRSPLNRIVAAVTRSLLKTAKDSASEKLKSKLKEYEATPPAGMIEKQWGVNPVKPLTEEAAKKVETALKENVVGIAINKAVQKQFSVNLAQTVQKNVGKSVAEITAKKLTKQFKKRGGTAALAKAVGKSFGVDLSGTAQDASVAA